MPRDLGPSFEIEQPQLFGQCHVVERFEVELRRRVLAAAHFEVGLIVDP